MRAERLKLWPYAAPHSLRLPLGPGCLMTQPDATENLSALWARAEAGDADAVIARTLTGSLTCENIWCDLSAGARPLEAGSLATDGQRVRLQLTIHRATPALLALAAPGTGVTASAQETVWTAGPPTSGPAALPALLWMGRTPFGLAAVRFAHALCEDGLRLDFGAGGKGIPCVFTAMTMVPEEPTEVPERPWQVTWLEVNP